MTKNVGLADRLLRIALGLVLIALPFVAPGVLAGLAAEGSALFYAPAAIGAVFVLTALVSFCPIYRVLGVCTTPSA